MKSINLQSVFFLLLLFAVNQSVAQEIEGGFSGTKYDIFVVNDDESSHDAAIRLQTRNGNSWKDWNIWNNRQDGKLFFSYWSGSSHSNSNENDIGTYRMTLQSNGNLGVGKTSPSYRIHAAGDIYADGGWMRVSGNRGIYFQSHGGGLYMTDGTWIRTYGNKNFYHNTGIMRTDGALQVGDSGSRFHVSTNGNVGIGRTTPNAKLDVAGAGVFDGHLSFKAEQGRGLRFWESDYYAINMGNASEFKYGPVQDYSIKMNMNDDADRGWTWGVDGQTPIAALSTRGNMQIAGTLVATNVTVNVGSFPDYVFADDYQLLSIEEVNQYIKLNKHLPNIPAASEIEKSGMNLGQINVLLTEKVEELTLYTIQQQEELKALNTRKDEQVKEITELKAEASEMKQELSKINELLQEQNALIQQLMKKKKKGKK